MTASSTVSNATIGTDMDVLPQSENLTAIISSGSGLPRPISTHPDIADTGRISFGAAMRLPSKK